MPTIGARIKKVRGNLSQAEFATIIGFSQRTIGHYEKDERSPDAEAIKNICAKFSVDPRWLLFGDENFAPPAKPVDSSPEQAPPSGLEFRQLERELRQLLRDNADLRVEVERLRHALELASQGNAGIIKRNDLASAG